MKSVVQFVRDEDELEAVLERLKQVRCPHCGRRETLNRHDVKKGNDLTTTNKQKKCGQRAWCSNRGLRNGCGLTISILFASVLPRHSLTAPLLDALLERLGKGGSIQAAWEAAQLPMPLDSIYHVLQRFRRCLDRIRTRLLARGHPPASPHADPLRQTAEHLKSAFTDTSSPISAFQYAFQCPLMG